MSLEEALKGAKTLWDKNRVATISREAAAKDLGYSGLTGRSLQVLGALNQYGLTENTAKGHMRVTKLGETALIGFPEGVKRKAISEAARFPSFFRDILDRFDGEVPGENAVRFFLLQNGFTNDGVEKALKVFAETIRFVEINGDSESYGNASESVAESSPEQQSQEEPKVATAPVAPSPAAQGGTVFWNSGALDFSLSSSGLAVTGRANSKKAVDAFADKLKALAALLPEDDDDEAE
jgi:hypothetical protein